MSITVTDPRNATERSSTATSVPADFSVLSPFWGCGPPKLLTNANFLSLLIITAYGQTPTGILLSTFPSARSTTATSLGMASATNAILLSHNPMPRGVVVLLPTDRSIFFVTLNNPDLPILPTYKFFFASLK